MLSCQVSANAAMKILRLCLLGWLACGIVSAHAASSDKNAALAAPLFDTAMSRVDVLLAGGDNPGAEKQYRIALQQGPSGEARADALHKLGIALAQQQRSTRRNLWSTPPNRSPAFRGTAFCWRTF